MSLWRQAELSFHETHVLHARGSQFELQHCLSSTPVLLSLSRLCAWHCNPQHHRTQAALYPQT